SALAAILLSAGLTGSVVAQQETISARQLEREIRWARNWVVDVYDGHMWSPGPFFPFCDEDEGDRRNCLRGDEECPHCAWDDERTRLRRLASVYDSVGRMALRAEPGASIPRLNWIAGQRVGLWTRL